MKGAGCSELFLEKAFRLFGPTLDGEKGGSKLAAPSRIQLGMAVLVVGIECCCSHRR